uniref:phage protein GemA/Gp16 family protein n=1 Tax=Edwardsiella tarda TaxID=636 RepID=UPI00054FD1DF
MRSNTIKLIHVARRTLGLDDETYRAMLATVVPGKNSCRDMSLQELKKVINALEDKGFTVKVAKRPRRMTS